jgi:hypothetical protein
VSACFPLLNHYFHKKLSLYITVSKGDQYNLSDPCVVVHLLSGACLVRCCVPCQLARTARRRRAVCARLNEVYCYKGAAKNILPYGFTVLYIHIPHIYLGLYFEFGPQRIMDVTFVCP